MKERDQWIRDNSALLTEYSEAVQELNKCKNLLERMSNSLRARGYVGANLALEARELTEERK